MKQFINTRRGPGYPLIKLLIVWSLVVLCLILLASCRSTRSSKSKVKTDSTSVTHTSIDSTVKKDSVHLSKTDLTSFVKSDTSKSKGTTVIEERKKIVEFNDSGKVKKITYQKKKTTHSEEKASGITIDFLQGGNLDSAGITEQITYERVQDDSTHKKQDIKVKQHQAKGFSILSLWWVLLLILAYLIYRYWDKIKSFILPILPI